MIRSMSRFPSPQLLAVALFPLGLGGCIAKTAVDIVTLPIKVASATVDAVTVSQAEADQKRGRLLREHEECLGKEARRARHNGREPDPARCPEKRSRSAERGDR